MGCNFLDPFPHDKIFHGNGVFEGFLVVGNAVACDHLPENCFLIIMNCKNSLKFLCNYHFYTHTFCSLLSPFKSPIIPTFIITNIFFFQLVKSKIFDRISNPKL